MPRNCTSCEQPFDHLPFGPRGAAWCFQCWFDSVDGAPVPVRRDHPVDDYLASLCAERDGLACDLEDAEDRVAELQEDLQEAERTVDDLERQLNGLEKAIAARQSLQVALCS